MIYIFCKVGTLYQGRKNMYYSSETTEPRFTLFGSKIQLEFHFKLYSNISCRYVKKLYLIYEITAKIF